MRLEIGALIEILYQVGFLTARPPGDTDRPGDDGFLGVHQVQQLNLDAVRQFQVHPMFRNYLGTQPV
ncbi:hypothetical protein [Spirillospora sp. NPDC047279]|uniref:hypothetical protein n=1 Tax=Spirillospora sp. NPDC047279 TaxID=3155478 RepID=UPI0034005966